MGVERFNLEMLADVKNIANEMEISAYTSDIYRTYEFPNTIFTRTKLFGNELFGKKARRVKVYGTFDRESLALALNENETRGE